MKTILVVDDNQDLRKTTVQMLKLKGFRVFEAENGEEGLEIIRNEPIDLIFTDLVMPGKVRSIDMVNLALVELCKKDIKVIYTSGYPEMNKALLDDRATVIQKPYRLNDVVEKINEMLT